MKPYNGSGESFTAELPTVAADTAPKVPAPLPTAPIATIGQDEKKIEQRNPIQYYIKASFMITYVLLLTTATITIIEALRTNIPRVRHILNLETCISLVAGYFYSVFLAQIEGFEKDDKKIDWANITKTRYVDWAITTPMMLFVLCIVLGIESKREIGLSTMLLIVFLNYCMLYLGYLGEVGTVPRMVSFFASFVAFFGIFYLIFTRFVNMKLGIAVNFLFFFYLIVWGMYGLVYLLDEEHKNITMNILDCISKCFIGLGLWVYYAQIIQLN